MKNFSELAVDAISSLLTPREHYEEVKKSLEVSAQLHESVYNWQAVGPLRMSLERLSAARKALDEIERRRSREGDRQQTGGGDG